MNRAVAEAAEPRRVFVNAVDDPANASAFLSGVVRRDGVTIAISTDGNAPALTALVREGLDALLPPDLNAWMAIARDQRVEWRREQVPMDQRKPRLLRALNALYHRTAHPQHITERTFDVAQDFGPVASMVDRDPSVPWLSGPEDSWL